MSATEQSLNRFLHAIADPTRRKILSALRERGGCSLDKETGLCAVDIEQRIHVSQPTVSHHMAILKKAGLVEAKKEGLWRWYQRNDKAISEMTKFLKESL
jgi:ArsR family transcriptional regulator